MVERAIALDGTCTGEHGVGIGKRVSHLYDSADTVDVPTVRARRWDTSGYEDAKNGIRPEGYNESWQGKCQVIQVR
jgi:hypothetical protein